MKALKVEQLPIGEIKENPLNGAIFNEVDPEKYEALKSYIRKSGLLKPLIVNRENVLLSGHARLKICRELGLERVPVQRISLPDAESEQEFLIKDNLLSRTLSPIEIGKAGIHLEKIARHVHRNGQRTRDIVARTLGISSFQYEKVKTIILYGTRELIRRVDRGEISVGRAYAQLKLQRQRNELAKMMMGEKPRFRIVNEDPLAILQNFRPGSCGVIVAEPPAGYNPVWIGLAHKALSDTGSLFVFTQSDFRVVSEILAESFRLVAPICVLGRTHQDGRFIYNHKLLLWFSKPGGCRINDERISTVWDFRSFGDPITETFARIVSLTTSTSDIVVNLFGDNKALAGLNDRLQRHIFSVQPDREQFLREKLKA